MNRKFKIVTFEIVTPNFWMVSVYTVCRYVYIYICICMYIYSAYNTKYTCTCTHTHTHTHTGIPIFMWTSHRRNVFSTLQTVLSIPLPYPSHKTTGIFRFSLHSVWFVSLFPHGDQKMVEIFWYYYNVNTSTLSLSGKKVQKLLLGWYLFKSYIFVPKGSISVP